MVMPDTRERPSTSALTVSTSSCNDCDGGPAGGTGAAGLLSLLKKEPMSGDVPGVPVSSQRSTPRRTRVCLNLPADLTAYR